LGGCGRHVQFYFFSFFQLRDLRLTAPVAVIACAHQITLQPFTVVV
jgi:hypothetical protein